jgi:general secretion pathway protein M
MKAIKQWLNDLSEQERQFFFVVVILVSILSIYWIIISPLNNYVSRLESQVKSKKKSDYWMSQNVSLIRSSDSLGSGSTNMPLTSIINTTSREFNLSVSRRDSKSPNEMQIWFDNVSFDSFIRWANAVESKYGTSIVSLNIRGRERKGTTSINVKLVK